MLPGSLFFQFLYNESLFLLLVMGLWWTLERGSYQWAAMPALLLPLTRPIGVFYFLPILWHVLSVWPPNWLKRCPRLWMWLEAGHLLAPAVARRKDRSIARRSNCRQVAAGMVVGAGAFWWMAVLSVADVSVDGNAFEGFAAQRYWGVHSISHLWNVPKFILAWLTPDKWHGYTGSLLDRSVFTLLIWCLPLIWKLDKRLIAWTYVLGILPAMSGEFTSYTRFASVDFPMFIALGVFFAPANRHWLGYGLLGIFVVLHAVLVWRYVNFQWAS